jgi:hypothetical protein
MIRMMKTRAKWKRIVIVLTFAGVAAAVCLLGASIRNACKAARQSRAYGRLYQMSFALQMYEDANGQLPPLWQRDGRGRSLHSWRVMLLPYLEARDDFKKLDLAKPWNSEPNCTVLRSSQAWGYFAGEDRYFAGGNLPHPHTISILALVGRDSVWNAETGIPKANTAACSDRILLIHVPHSDIEPWEPRDITEEELRTRVEQREEVFFIDANKKYGKVQIANGNLVFVRGY